MNTLINSVHLIGNLGMDVEIKNFESGSKKASFSLATTENVKNNKGEYIKNTQWHNIIAWGRNAELMSKALAKGNRVAIQGTINYRSYQDKAGVIKYITEIIASDFMKFNNEVTNQKSALTEATPF